LAPPAPRAIPIFFMAERHLCYLKSLVRVIYLPGLSS
jgi:hypothetical protein